MKIGIRREDKNQWEARVPLIPVHLRELHKKYGIEFFIQPSKIRVFSDEEFKGAGAIVSEELSKCQIILGIKEMPIHFFELKKIYLFFSHTIKGQRYNMPILKKMMELKDTLIDYERIVDKSGKRVVFFGRFAGIAGMIDTFWILGRRLEWEGFKTIFSNLKQALNYFSLEGAKNVFKEQGQLLSKEGLPDELVPMVFGFTGYGNASKGAQEIFDLFPHEEILPENIADFIKKGEFSKHLLYKVVFKEKDIVKPKELTHIFELKDYYERPEKYASRFDDYLPYLSVLINAIYWNEKYPRLVTKSYLKRTYETGGRLPLRVIGDITCDVGGSIECNVKTTDSGNPVYVYDPISGKIESGVRGNGPVILAIDNLPCELPKESSSVFSDCLKNFIPELMCVNFSESFENLSLPPELKRATIIHKGNLTPHYRYLEEYLQ